MSLVGNAALGRRVILSWALLGAGLGCAAVQQTGPAAARPAAARPAASGGKIQFLNRAIDFGTVTRGEELSYRFHFKNVGAGPLRIQGVHAACGCTVVEVPSHKTYAPGEGDAIELRFKTANFVGPVTKAVTVMSNEPLSPNRTLTLRAQVVAEFMADPPVVDFGAVEDPAGVERTVLVSPVAGFPLKLGKPSFNRELFEVELTEDTKKNYQVHVRLKPISKTGFLKESIVVPSNSKSLPQLKIMVRANLAGPIRYEPNYVEFGAIPKDGHAKRLLKLRAHHEFAITKSWLELSLNGRALGQPDSYFTVVTRDGLQNDKDVEVTLRNGAELAGSVHGKMFFETNNARQRQIVLDFYGFFL